MVPSGTHVFMQENGYGRDLHPIGERTLQWLNEMCGLTQILERQTDGPQAGCVQYSTLYTTNMSSPDSPRRTP